MNNRNNIPEIDARLRTELMTYLSKFQTLTSEEVEAIAANMKVKLYEKGSVLVNEGDICHECYFVLKGCLRQFRLVNGIEKTTQFYTEEQAAVFFTSYTTQAKSESYLSCVEDSILLIGEPTKETEMYQKFPKLIEITRQMMEQDFGKTQDALAYFMASSPEERYLNLLENRPDLLQRVPQHQLAGYIGVTPESLSRIRKRILKEK